MNSLKNIKCENDMSTEQHEALIPAPLNRTDIARLWREVQGSSRMTPGEEEFARRVERAALEVQHALIVQMTEALINAEALFPCQMYADALDAATQYLKGPKT